MNCLLTLLSFDINIQTFFLKKEGIKSEKSKYFQLSKKIYIYIFEINTDHNENDLLV